MWLQGAQETPKFALCGDFASRAARVKEKELSNWAYKLMGCDCCF
jgi:hypothetical protein